MASTSFKLIFLRPLPNAEFVQGFPGIPSHLPERQPATIRGVVELRPSDTLDKAQWIKIELRKLETLPGGGHSNTYIDFVGDSPITLWQAKNEWDEIRLQDLSFQIRVPESIPPSLALERSAGIKYELVASILTKGKKGILRREATQVVTASCQIVIDKHELHSAWPMYARPESRSEMLDGYILTVNRTHQAYGPGDRIAVQTLLKNDTQQVNQVRYYELSIREDVMYKPGGTQNGTRKMMNQPQTRSRAIVQQRIPITMASPLHPGGQAKAELSLQVPFNLTTTTVSFAHRIEVQFIIHVRAVLATGLQLFLDLPITMSNWTRAQSIDVVRRIGPAGTLSNPGGVPGPATSPPAGFEQHPMASPPQVNPQPQMGGWPPNGAADPNYFNSRRVTVNGPPNGMAPSPSGDFVGGWAAANPPPIAATMTGPQPHHSDYPNEFGGLPAGAAQRPMTVGGVPNNFTPQGSFLPSPPIIPPLPPVNSGPSPVNGINGKIGNNIPEEANDPTPRRRPLTGGSGGNPQQRFSIINLSGPRHTDMSSNAFPPANQHPMASPPQRAPQPQMGGWPPNAAAYPNYFNSRPVTVNGPPNGMAPSPSGDFVGGWPAPIFSGKFMDGWVAEAAERLSVTETMSSPQQPHSVYGNEFSAMPGGSLHPSSSMSSAAASNRFTRRVLYVQSNPPLDADKLRIWASESPSSPDTKAPSDEVRTGNALYQSALASIRQRTLPPVSTKDGTGSHPSAPEEKQQISSKQTIELANHTQLDVYENEAAPVPYETLYPSGPSEPSAPAIAPTHPQHVTRSQPPDQGQDMDVDNFSSASPIPPSPEGRFAAAKEGKEWLGQIYEAQESSARRSGGTTVNGTPFDSPPHRLFDGPGTPAAQSRRALPPPPATAGSQSITATQGKPMLKDVPQSGSGPRPLPPPPRKWAPLSLSPFPPSSADTHQSSQQPNSSLNGGEMPLPPSSFSVAKPSTAGENNAQPRAEYAAEEVGEESASGSPSG